MRYLIDFSYSGENFYGYQKQGILRCVQSEVEKVLTNINNNKEVIIYSSGRTDRKVNALHQMAHFDLDFDIGEYKLKGALNSYLPDDIYINEVKKVSKDFHARYLVKEKTYEYKINLGVFNPLQRTYVYQYGKPLNINEMTRAIKYFKGEHDFTTFVSKEDKRINKVRTITNCDIKIENMIITITFSGTGFLKYQVRNMVGLLIKIGEGKEESSSVPKIIEFKNRTKIGLTAPACGLTLVSVKY